MDLKFQFFTMLQKIEYLDKDFLDLYGFSMYVNKKAR